MLQANRNTDDSIIGVFNLFPGCRTFIGHVNQGPKNIISSEATCRYTAKQSLTAAFLVYQAETMSAYIPSNLEHMISEKQGGTIPV